MAALPLSHRRCTKRHAACALHRARAALTLIELLLTIAVLGILAAILIPQLTGDLPERLSAGAQVVAADLDYARSLAVANNGSYRITFEPNNNRYYLRYSGTLAQFNTLPRSPFRQNDDPADQQTTNLSLLPIPEPGVRLVAAFQMQASPLSTPSVEFTSLGGTTSTYPTVIWLGCGAGGPLQRYIPISVDPVTGLVSIGSPVTALPSPVASVVPQSAQSVSVGGGT